jgi:ABC-type glycerol-3-phosphate transport system permease component
MTVGKRKINVSPLLIIIGVILALYLASMIALFVWSLLTSLKDEYADIRMFGNTYGLPREWVFLNYKEVFLNLTMAGAPGQKLFFENILLNSLLYAVGCAFFKTLVPCIAAYACARFDTKLGKLVHSVVLITMIVPIVGSLPSELKVAYAIGFHNKIWGLWIMSANMQGLYFFVMYSAFKAMPMGYSEAAKIDGANQLQIMVRIALPLVKNLFFTIMLIMFVEYWNNYQVPMVYLPYYPTLGYTLFYKGPGSNEMNNLPQVISLAVIVATPVLILFLIFQEKLMGNLTMGGLKG